MKDYIASFLIAVVAILIVITISIRSKEEGYKEGYNQALHDCISGAYEADTIVNYKPIEQ